MNPKKNRPGSTGKSSASSKAGNSVSKKSKGKAARKQKAYQSATKGSKQSQMTPSQERKYLEKKARRDETHRRLRELQAGLDEIKSLDPGSGGKGGAESKNARPKEKGVKTASFKFRSDTSRPLSQTSHPGTLKGNCATHFKAGRHGGTYGQRAGRTTATGGQKIKSVVKSRYVKSGVPQEVIDKMVDYMQFRELGAFEKERKFFKKDEKDIDGEKIKKEIKEKQGRKVGFHTMIISPGDNSLNMMGYVRAIMDEWSAVLGKAIDYYAVIHQNTNHYHAHVIIPGQLPDSRGDLRLSGEHLAGLRFISDEYIARDRMLDTELNRKIDIQLGYMEARFADLGKLLDLGLSYFRTWKDQIDLGLRTDDDYRRDMEALGMGVGAIYDLGRPFEGLKETKPKTELDKEKEDDKHKDNDNDRENTDGQAGKEAGDRAPGENIHGAGKEELSAREGETKGKSIEKAEKLEGEMESSVAQAAEVGLDDIHATTGGLSVEDGSSGNIGDSPAGEAETAVPQKEERDDDERGLR